MAVNRPILIGDCPRCGARRITFDVFSTFRRESWLHSMFCMCRECFEGTVFDASTNRPDIDLMRESEGQVANAFCNKVSTQVPKLHSVEKCPEFVPEDIKAIFEEAALCRAFSCYSASGAMYRKVIDQSTRKLVSAKPSDTERVEGQITWKQFKDLRLRLDWLISNNALPNELIQLVECVREDGNDAAHALETIGAECAADLEDFSVAILETLFTIPGRVQRNIARRADRRS